MRIISGYLGGRNFEAPRGHRTHPMSDKARGGLFNVLGDIEGLTVLDAFAGSGALGFEALSRGAKHITAVEVDKGAHQTIERNRRALGLDDRMKAIRANVSSWSDNNPDKTFDLVFCDPPYDNMQSNVLQKLERHLRPSGLLVLSWPGKLVAPELKNLEVVRHKDHGDIQLLFYKHAQ